jgi:hypothetical protein
MRRLFLFIIFSIASASAQNSSVAESSPASQSEGQIAPNAKIDDTTAPEKKTAKDSTRPSENAANPLLTVNPETKDERELHDSLMTKVRSLNVGGSKAESETPQRRDDNENIWEDFKTPLIVIGSLLIYFIPTLLGMKRNDFKKVFLINLIHGCTFGAGLIAMHFYPFPMQWLYIWAGVSWVLALVPLFLKDCAPPPERERRRKHRSRKRSVH